MASLHQHEVQLKVVHDFCYPSSKLGTPYHHAPLNGQVILESGGKSRSMRELQGLRYELRCSESGKQSP